MMRQNSSAHLLNPLVSPSLPNTFSVPSGVPTNVTLTPNLSGSYHLTADIPLPSATIENVVERDVRVPVEKIVYRDSIGPKEVVYLEREKVVESQNTKIVHEIKTKLENNSKKREEISKQAKIERERGLAYRSEIEALLKQRESKQEIIRSKNEAASLEIEVANLRAKVASFRSENSALAQSVTSERIRSGAETETLRSNIADLENEIFLKEGEVQKESLDTTDERSEFRNFEPQFLKSNREKMSSLQIELSRINEEISKLSLKYKKKKEINRALALRLVGSLSALEMARHEAKKDPAVQASTFDFFDRSS